MNDPKNFLKKRLKQVKHIQDRKKKYVNLDQFAEINYNQLRNVLNNQEFKNKVN